MSLHYTVGNQVCIHCGKLGCKRRGYSRGGVHATKVFYNQPDNAEELKAKAERWNAERLAEVEAGVVRAISKEQQDEDPFQEGA